MSKKLLILIIVLFSLIFAYFLIDKNEYAPLDNYYEEPKEGSIYVTGKKEISTF